MGFCVKSRWVFCGFLLPTFFMSHAPSQLLLLADRIKAAASFALVPLRKYKCVTFVRRPTSPPRSESASQRSCVETLPDGLGDVSARNASRMRLPAGVTTSRRSLDLGVSNKDAFIRVFAVFPCISRINSEYKPASIDEARKSHLSLQLQSEIKHVLCIDHHAHLRSYVQTCICAHSKFIHMYICVHICMYVCMYVGR